MMKIETQGFDLDVQIPLMDGTEVEIPCVKPMTSKTYIEWLAYCRTVFENPEEVAKMAIEDPGNALKGVIKQIDWLYEKGDDFWENNVSPDIVIAVQNRLKEYHGSFGKKKGGA